MVTVADLDTFALDFAISNDLAEDWFKGCYLKDSTCSRILSDLTEGFAIRVRATPTYIIDGVAVSWYADNIMEDYLRQTYLKGAVNPPKKGESPAKKGVK